METSSTGKLATSVTYPSRAAAAVAVAVAVVVMMWLAEWGVVGTQNESG